MGRAEEERYKIVKFKRASESLVSEIPGRSLRRPIQLPVHTRITQDGLNVLASFGERNRFHEFLWIAVFRLAQPILNAIRTSVVGRQRIFEGAEFIHHGTEVARSKLKIYCWSE